MSNLGKQLGLRVSDEDIARLDALAEKFPLVSKNAIARVAIRLGMGMIEKDQSKLFISKEAKL